MKHLEYAVIIEKADDGSYSAYVPDLPGCVSGGCDTREEVEQSIREGIEFHLEGLRKNGDPIPPPTSSVAMIGVNAA
jgi:predicted RNase H-like HicB family nuclease